MKNFCTLFDSYYFMKGLSLYYSLERVCKNFHLYIFAFDDLAYETLVSLDLKYATIISLKEFETEELLEIKKNRNTAEYCWTCKGPTLKYCFDNYNIESCTYLDSDLYFFDDPEILFEEVLGYDVMLTEHHYTSEYDLSKTNGKYCAHFMYFRNSENGLKVLSWWTNLCLEWCFSYHEVGRFGDQKYLEEFSNTFTGVCILKHLGGGVAPWNIQQYTLLNRNSKPIGINKSDKSQFNIIFYHFHFLKIQRIKFIEEYYLGPYLYTNKDKRIIYRHYIKQLRGLIDILKAKGVNVNVFQSTRIEMSFLKFILHVMKNWFHFNKIFYFNLSK